MGPKGVLARRAGIALALLLAALLGSAGCGEGDSCREGYHECVSSCHDSYLDCDRVHLYDWCQQIYTDCLEYCADQYCTPLEQP